MLEIYFLLFYIPRKVRSLTKERGQSALMWSLMAIGAWVVAEVGVLVVAVLLAVLSPALLESGLFLFLLYVITFLAAAGAASLVIRKLRQMPVRQGIEAPWQ